MKLISTRNRAQSVSAPQAVLTGLSPEGGLFVPDCLPQFTQKELGAMTRLSHREVAARVMERFLPGYEKREIAQFCQMAYSPDFIKTQGQKDILPITGGEDQLYFVEQWHGPTCAFKDFGLQMLPYLLGSAAKKWGGEVAILTATSGDTGKAALEGFADVPGARICVFYPQNGVSEMQRLQMVTQRGENVMVVGVRGNFDDAQTGVKKAFSDESLRKELGERGIMLSSANSINWGRLVPQIAYYFTAYTRLLLREDIYPGQKVNVCVPTGNFGNILAGYLAKKSGLPISKLICASNQNRVLDQFIRTGVYDRNREFYATTSPSMDILVSSNVERLLFILSGGDDQLVKDCMGKLSATGRYQLDSRMLNALRDEGFVSGYADDGEVKDEIKRMWAKEMLCDPHTAVGVKVYREFRGQSGDTTPTLLLSTASPFKFAGPVLEALGKNPPEDEFEQMERLSVLTGQPIPSPLKELKGLKERFSDICDKDRVPEKVRDWLVGQ